MATHGLYESGWWWMLSVAVDVGRDAGERGGTAMRSVGNIDAALT